MQKRITALLLAACMLVLAGCACPQGAAPPDASALLAETTPKAQEEQDRRTGETAYEAALFINGLPFSGMLERQGTSSKWRFLLAGEQREDAMIEEITVSRIWKVSFDLAKQEPAGHPNGLYTGTVDISLHYDLAAFDRAAFELILDRRGDGEDFDQRAMGGWLSHDAYAPSVLVLRWRLDDFDLFIGGLQQGGKPVAKTLHHTLSYLPQAADLQLLHRLFYDLRKKGEQYTYTLTGSKAEQAALLRLVKHEGRKPKKPPVEPVARLDLSGAFGALQEADILLRITAP